MSLLARFRTPESRGYSRVPLAASKGRQDDVRHCWLIFPSAQPTSRRRRPRISATWWCWSTFGHSGSPPIPIWPDIRQSKLNQEMAPFLKLWAKRRCVREFTFWTIEPNQAIARLLGANMKTILVAAAFLFSISAFSQAQVEVWACNVSGEPSGQSVTVILPTPTLDYFLKYVTQDGKTIEKHEELITPTTVTSYKADRSKCAEAGATSADGLQYSYRFSCGSINGYLHFHKDGRNGFYRQQLGGTGPSRSIGFVSCNLVQ